MEDKVRLPFCGRSIAFLDLEGHKGRQRSTAFERGRTVVRRETPEESGLSESQRERHISFDLYNQSKVSRATTIPIAYMRKSSLREIKGFMEYS